MYIYIYILYEYIYIYIYISEVVDGKIVFFCDFLFHSNFTMGNFQIYC